MRAAMYYGNHKMEIEDIPEPAPGEGQVKVRVSRNGDLRHRSARVLRRSDLHPTRSATPVDR